ncbi:unnamed protein product [Prorocentrum cordatum]|uniref:F-box domain-containing protein n=1 Tax=Prorocentrum cordatum TaxID=2364126 RepID=A0ABN9WAZ2_9DINO|nr:unnamed protein product [Polarella glacialis]|mmetsp:Transcript_90684/g.236163  ORF Transcript_90684/g.236163 Transcript_90684/m.236163 type:complete len:245 (+) Transcript_90684:67-801(+)
MAAAMMDEELHLKVLSYVAEPKASLSCKSWREFLCRTLHLGLRSGFYRTLAAGGKVVFCYNAVRPLAEDFEESVSYNFVFEPGGFYRMQWTRTFDAWSSQSEQQHGRWQVILDSLLCETLEPKREVRENEVRFAPPGYRFRIPIDDVLQAAGTYYTTPLGSPAAEWELPARTGKEDRDFCTVRSAWETPQVEDAPSVHVPFREGARFVEIDGEMHEVSGDIVSNWPEDEWPRLMKCRLRWGING